MVKNIAAAAIAAVVLYGCATVPVTGRKQLSFIPDSQINSMSADSYRELVGKSTLSTDKAKTATVERVGRRIAAAAEEFLRENGAADEVKDYSWEFKLIRDDKTVNAFCMPGGKVAVYTGILPLASTDDELAVVMGHEVAHAIAKHGSERMSQQMVAQLGGTALSYALKEKPEQTKQLYMAAYGAGAQVGVLLPFSRGHESEADYIGLVLAAKAGYDPRVSVGFWEKMNKLGGERPMELLSTHPAPENRIKDLQQKGIPEAMKYYRKR